MKTEVVRSLDGLLAIRQEWEELWQQIPQPTPYQSWMWLRTWVGSTEKDRDLFIIVVRDDNGRLIGIAPLQRIPLPIPGLHVLVFVGQETSISQDVLALPRYEQEVCNIVMERACTGCNRVGMVLKMADPLAGAVSLLDENNLTKFGQGKVTRYSVRSILQLPASYEDFIDSLGTKMRQEMRVARKKLSTEHELTFTEGRQGALEDLLVLNDKRWGQSGGRRVYQRVYSELMNTGMLKIFSLHIDGRLAAGLSVLRTKNAIFAEIAGFDYEVESRHLGKCFYGMVIEWAIQNDFQYFDFSSGNEEYKQRYNPRVYPKYRVEFYGSPLKKFLCELSMRAALSIRWLRNPALA